MSKISLGSSEISATNAAPSTNPTRFKTGASITTDNTWYPMTWTHSHTALSGSANVTTSTLIDVVYTHASLNTRNSYLAFASTVTTSIFDRGTNEFTLTAATYNWLPKPQRARSRMSVLKHGGRRR